MNCGPLWLPAQPYADEDDLLCECAGVDFDGPAWEWAKYAASRRVYEVTMGAWPGTMASKIRPCRRCCTTNAERLSMSDLLRRPRWPPALPYVIDDGPAPVLVNVWACECGLDPCTCTKRDAFVLPYRPVCEVTEVRLDGEVFTAWSLVGARLYRTDGLPWPTCNAAAADTEPGTWSVSVTHGQGAPPEGKPLIAMFACELAKRACKQACELPDGVRVISRPGVEFAVVDYAYRDAVLTGFGPLDDWLNVMLGGVSRARERPRLWTRSRAACRPTHRLESRRASPAVEVTGDGVMREVLHLRTNDDTTKTVSYPGRVIEGGHLTAKDALGNVVVDELANVTGGVATFEITAGSWAWPGAERGEWDMAIKLVGGGWEAIAGGPAVYHQGVATPVF